MNRSYLKYHRRTWERAKGDVKGKKNCGDVCASCRKFRGETGFTGGGERSSGANGPACNKNGGVKTSNGREYTASP